MSSGRRSAFKSRQSHIAPLKGRKDDFKCMVLSVLWSWHVSRRTDHQSSYIFQAILNLAAQTEELQVGVKKPTGKHAAITRSTLTSASICTQFICLHYLTVQSCVMRSSPSFSSRLSKKISNPASIETFSAQHTHSGISHYSLHNRAGIKRNDLLSGSSGSSEQCSEQLYCKCKRREKATTELEADQQSVRRNSKFSIRAAENAASICMTNGTFVQGVRGLQAGHELGGPSLCTVHSSQGKNLVGQHSSRSSSKTFSRVRTEGEAAQTSSHSLLQSHFCQR